MIDFVNQNSKLKDFMIDTASVAGFLWEKGMAESNAGNITANISHLITSPFNSNNKVVTEKLTANFSSIAGMYFYVSATGRRMRDLSKDIYANSIIIKIADDGNNYIKISKDNAKDIYPTSELLTHLSLHQQFSESGNVNKIILHTHPTDIIALTQIKIFKNEDHLNKILWSMHPETIIAIPEGVGFVPYELPGSINIALATIEKSKKYNFIIWEKHGVFSLGKNILDIFDTVDVVNKSASIYIKCKSTGTEPEGLNEQQLEGLRELAKKFRK